MAICEYIDCKLRALYNYNGNPPILCKSHKDDDMVDISKKCIKCYMVRAGFNYKGIKKPLYCKTCKLDEMINVTNKMCIKCDLLRPNFNYDGEKKGLYCDGCKLVGMVNVVSIKCKECKTRANFGIDGERPEYCEKHKKDNMIELRSKKCELCKKQAIYNIKGKLSRYCNDHKKDNMVDVQHRKCLKCDLIPCFNYDGEKKGLYCNGHKKDNMVNVITKKCVLCNDIQISNTEYKGYCLRCFIYTFPNNKISKTYKIKEDHVKNYIETEFENQFIFDKVIDGGCSKRRPDAFKDCKTHSLIIEVDENQHKYYEKICENKRMMQLFGDLANRPIVFIRFNPDGYINQYNKKIMSSFIISKKNDIPIIRHKQTWNNRLIKLKEKIEYNIKNIPEKTVTIINLFYDNNN
jgi:hypothetical protein